MAQSAAAAAAFVGDLTMFVAQIRIWLVVAADVDSSRRAWLQSLRSPILPVVKLYTRRCRFRGSWTLRMEPTRM